MLATLTTAGGLVRDALFANEVWERARRLDVAYARGVDLARFCLTSPTTETLASHDGMLRAPSP